MVKVSKPKEGMRLDVPVVGPRRMEVMPRCGAAALASDAGRALIFERAGVVEMADAVGIAIEAAAHVDVEIRASAVGQLVEPEIVRPTRRARKATTPAR